MLEEEDDGQLVVYGEHGGLGHIKVGSGATCQQVVEESLALKQQTDNAERLLENAFEARLQEFDTQLRLDRTAPKDGHCLFHGLRTEEVRQSRLAVARYIRFAPHHRSDRLKFSKNGLNISQR